NETSKAIAPNCHQKFATSDGAICDQARADRSINKTSGTHAPCASTGQSLFQFTPQSHQAIQARTSHQCNPRRKSSSTNLLTETRICQKDCQRSTGEPFFKIGKRGRAPLLHTGG